MGRFRMVLAVLFSFLIVGGIRQYYTSHETITIQDPFQRIWTKLARYTDVKKDGVTNGTLVDTIPESDRIDTPNLKDGDLHEDFTFGTMTRADLERLEQVGVLGGVRDGSLLWLHYCDFDAKYCQESYNVGVIYDYMEAYPTQLSYIYKPFPPTTLEHDMLPHRAMLCAADNASEKQFFSFYNALYASPEETKTINDLIVLGRSLGIDSIGTCLDENNYNLVIQQETKFARKLFNISALPANIFINKDTLAWVLVPGYYEKEEVIPAIAAIE